MSAIPGNTGSKFKSFHMAQHWEFSIPVQLLPQTVTFRVVAMPRGRGPSTTSEGQGRQGI